MPSFAPLILSLFPSPTFLLYFCTFDLPCCLTALLLPSCFPCSPHFITPPRPLFIVPIIPTSAPTPFLSSPLLLPIVLPAVNPFPLVPPQNHERETALHCAAQYGHSDVVSVLLQELTDPTMRNSQQETPLDLAALYGRLQVSENDTHQF